MEDSIKNLQLEVSELKESLRMSVELNEKLVGAVDDLRNQIINMNPSKGVVSEEDMMKDEIMKGLGLL